MRTGEEIEWELFAMTSITKNLHNKEKGASTHWTSFALVLSQREMASIRAPAF